MSCSVNTKKYGSRSIAQVCADAAAGDVVNDPAPCGSRGYYSPVGDPAADCTQNYLATDELSQIYGQAPGSIGQQIKSMRPSCFSCENYVHAPPVPWTRPGAYLNLEQTWGSQKLFQL